MLNIFRGGRPDITPAQLIGALFAAVGPVCLLLGVHLSLEQLSALDELKVVGLGLFGADAVIRVGRNYADGRTQAAAHLAAAQTPPPIEADPEVVDPDVDAVLDDDLPDDRTEFASPPPERPAPDPLGPAKGA